MDTEKRKKILHDFKKIALKIRGCKLNCPIKDELDNLHRDLEDELG